MSHGGEIPIPLNKQQGPEVPTCLTGTIKTAEPISYCMDSATHLLQTCFQDPVRLVPNNDSVKADLGKFAEKFEVVTVCGYFRAGVECRHLSVYHVDKAEKVVSALKKANVF